MLMGMGMAGLLTCWWAVVGNVASTPALIPEGFIGVHQLRQPCILADTGAIAWETITDFTTANHVEPHGFKM